ncbi:Ima1 N-terminal domain-containing protein [Phellopilus nigrolimitatus]|nr:Ima1 N-terminal domain-containing protein [Phellopilus nigrolimitatus]
MASLFRRPSTTTCYYCQLLVASGPSSSSSRIGGPAFDPTSFRCPHCGCWNRYDARGQIIGDEPAMRDAALNVDSFLKRGLPDRNQLPSLSTNAGPSFFCHTCKTNQTLLVNLLGAYLPAPDDPSYASRTAQLPAYSASLQRRYPPVCGACAPGVEAEIARRDEMARTRALGGALKVSNGRPGLAGKSNATTPASQKERGTRLGSWRARGVLWATSFMLVLAGNGTGALDARVPSQLWMLAPISPLIVLVSLTWTFWDPTYSLRQRSDVQGRQVRVEGRQKYIIVQCHAWISRLVTSTLLLSAWLRPEWDFLHIREMDHTDSRRKTFFAASLALEIIVLLLSYISITIRKPAPIRLIDTDAHRALAPLSDSAPANGRFPTPGSNIGSSVPATTGSQPDDLLATLSLSSNPVITGYAAAAAAIPMFGRPSIGVGAESAAADPAADNNKNETSPSYDDGDDEAEATNTPRRARARDPDAMDWEPATPAAKQQQQKRASQDDGSWLRRQRFFPPEEPTGLEGLLMSTRLLDEDGDDPSSYERTAGAQSSAQTKMRGVRWRWGWVYSASVLPILVLVGGMWASGRFHS